MTHLATYLTARLRHPRVREIFLWCLPALLIGLVLRVMLCVALPYAYFHDDGPDFFCTPDKLISEHAFELHEKKTFLVPILYTIPFALPAPVLVTIPIFQHLMGLGTIFLIGAICRYWFAAWRWVIIPITVLAAINPFYLWFEHTTMAETTFVFCTVLLAVAGTLYARKQSTGRFVLLCIALVLEAGARPEGKLLFGFGLFLLVLIHWRELKTAWRRPAIMVGLGLVTHLVTETSQAGLLLYTSVARLTPGDLKSAPGFDPYIAPIREDLQKRWEERPQFPRVRDRKAIAEAVGRYAKDRKVNGTGIRGFHDVNTFCGKLAKETCLRNLEHLPEFAVVKFRLEATNPPSGLLDNQLLFRKQREAFTGEVERTARLSRALMGQTLRTQEEINRFIDTNYGEVVWFNALTQRWLAIVNAIRLPDRLYQNPDPAYNAVSISYYGIPLYFIVAGVGLIAAMFRPGELRPFHIAWGLALLGFFFVIMLTANVRPRFRFVFEPFWFIYIALLVESLCLGVKRIIAR